MYEPVKNAVLLQDNSTGEPRWIAFRDPIEILQANSVNDVKACLEKAAAYTEKGYYIAGFMSYEASPIMDAALETKDLTEFPHLWFGVYEKSHDVELQASSAESASIEDDFTLSNLTPDISKQDYGKAIDDIKSHIYNGDTYQVNYTYRLNGEFSGSAWSCFKKLSVSQKADYASYIDIGRHKICSVSPELFITVNDGKVTSKPMKGTAKRGYTALQDETIANELHHSQKNRAENVMTVDMIRNDMGRIAKTGSVKVNDLFSIEQYPTVFQMTSKVTATVDGSIYEVLKNMYPCASITGAPKVKTMRIIKELEASPRGIYTGSIGYIAPNGNAQFNVAIRTLVVDSEQGTAEYGVGGGITWYSDTEDEYQECIAKASVLTHSQQSFDLFESILWQAEQGYYLLDLHMDRLLRSSRFFSFSTSEKDIVESLKTFAESITETSKVKVSLSKSGSISLSSQTLSSMIGKKVGVAKKALNTESIFLYHKSTERSAYDNAVSASPAMDDVILHNQDGYVTESSIANVVVKRNGKYVTPPLEHGLLSGVFRTKLINEGMISEQKIPLSQLEDCEAIYLINSVRGWMKLEKSDSQDYWLITNTTLTLPV